MNSVMKSNQTQQKKPETSASKEARGKVGDWVRHLSSSGKEYYFNICTHESHWEKPREWLDYEQRHGSVPYQGQVPTPVTPTKMQVKPTVVVLPASISNGKDKDTHQQQHPPSSSLQNLPPPAQAEPTTPSIPRALIKPLLDIAVTFTQTPLTKPTSSSSFSNQNGRTGQIEPLFKDRSPAFPSYYSRPSTSASAGSGSSSSQGYANSTYNGNDRSSSQNSQYMPSSNRQDNGNSSRKDSGQRQNYHRSSYSGRPRSRHSTPDRTRDLKKPSEEPQSDDMDISPYENEDSGTDTTTKPAERILETASTNVSSPNVQSFCSGMRNSRNYRDRDRNRDRDRDQGRNIFYHSGSSSRSNGTYSRDRYRGRDSRERDHGNYPPRRVGRDRDRDRNRDRDWRSGSDSQRDQDGDRRSRWSYRDSDRDRDRDREGDRTRARDNENHDEKLERPKNCTNERATPELEQSEVDEPMANSTDSHAAGSAPTPTDGTSKELVVSELPPGLAQYFREDLITEVKKTMDDPYEREADKVVNRILESQMKLTSISAELKMARSLVRLTDIQATLKEQRILFIRKQVECLEETLTTYTDGLNLGNTE